MKKDIRYVPTPTVVVEAMLDLGRLGPQDVLLDLGSGDGRLVMAAARRGNRAIGIEIDPSLIRRSRDAANQQQLSHLAEFRQQSLFTADLAEATVVTLYLGHALNLAIRPKLLAELRPGTRLVSHSFDMEEWQADRRITVDAKWIFLWTIPT